MWWLSVLRPDEELNMCKHSSSRSTFLIKEWALPPENKNWIKTRPLSDLWGEHPLHPQLMRLQAFASLINILFFLFTHSERFSCHVHTTECAVMKKKTAANFCTSSVLIQSDTTSYFHHILNINKAASHQKNHWRTADQGYRCGKFALVPTAVRSCRLACIFDEPQLLDPPLGHLFRGENRAAIMVPRGVFAWATSPDLRYRDGWWFD